MLLKNVLYQDGKIGCCSVRRSTRGMMDSLSASCSVFVVDVRAEVQLVVHIKWIVDAKWPVIATCGSTLGSRVFGKLPVDPE